MTGRPVSEAYRTALDVPCPTCGAGPGEYCTRTDDTGAPRTRRCPCVKRCPPGPPVVDETVAPARSFDEPLHELDDPEDAR